MVTLALVLGLGAWVTVRALGAALRSDIESENTEVLDALAGAISEGADVATLRIPLGGDGTEFLVLDDQGHLLNASVVPFSPSLDELNEIFEAEPNLVVSDAGVVVGSLTVAEAEAMDGVLLGPGLPGLAIGSTEEFVAPGFEGYFVDADDWFETRRSVTTPTGREVTLIALSPLGIVGRNIDRLSLAMTVIVPLLVLAGGAALWFALGAARAPVRRITDEANRIAPSNSGGRLPVPDADDEIAELTRTLNGMLDRLDAGLIRQRQFVSDASHELRSPLTAVRGAAELLADRQDLPEGAGPSVAALGRGTERLEAILDDLTSLASAGVSSSRDHVDLADLVGEEVSLARQPDGSIEIGTLRVEPMVVEANPVQLGRAVANLLTNAVRHAESRVEVAVRAGPSGVEVVVDDDGPGVAPQERERIFQRFVRLDDARTRDGGGTGLGLALVASIAADHDGTVICTDSPIGGARFTLRLPGGPDPDHLAGRGSHP